MKKFLTMKVDFYCKLIVVSLLLFSTTGFSQKQNISTLKATSALLDVKELRIINHQLQDKRSDFDEDGRKIIYLKNTDSLSSNREKNNGANQARMNGGNGYENGGPNNMIDKTTLKPTPGNFSGDIGPITDDLNRGKVAINIPLFDFEYYGFKIPVAITNNYPQKISQARSPVFYANSRVGGDWNLSIDQFKVSRQINGIEDENLSKGYFSSYSQNRVNNPANISSGDVVNGLKGDWDPQIDIFHFSTPTVSGSFLLDLNNGTFKNLTKDNFMVSYTRSGSTLTSFTVVDEEGTRYLFGGDVNSVEITQSKTNINSHGVDYGEGRLKYVVELEWDYSLQKYVYLSSAGLVAGRQNLYALCNLTGPVSPIPADDLHISIIQNGITSQNLDSYLCNLGNGCYGIRQDGDPFRGLLLQSTTDDPDMRRSPVNTGWYLREITLINGKKINLSYNNTWEAYATSGANSIEVEDFIRDDVYRYPGRNGDKYFNVRFYGCMPEVFDPLQFPINESYSETYHFVKKPKLVEIADQDQVSKIIVGSTGLPPVPRPYVLTPSAYDNAPQEAVQGGEPNPSFIQKISLLKNNRYFDVLFKNRADYGIITQNGEDLRQPWRDISYLDELTINGEKKYSFTYSGKSLSKIIYPTGATKQFFSQTYVSDPIRLSSTRYSNFYSNYYLKTDYAVSQITTTSENNTTTEKFVYEGNRGYYEGSNSTNKTFRPTVFACTSLAVLTSTSPLTNTYATKSGIYFPVAKKYINDELRVSSELLTSFSPYGPAYVTNPTVSVNGTIPVSISGTATVYEQRLGLLKKKTEFKKEVVDFTQKTTTYDYVFNDHLTMQHYPCIHLANIEAGPFSDTSGAVRRGYSRFYFPSEDDIPQISQSVKTYFDDNSEFSSGNMSLFKRYKGLGTNAYKLIGVMETGNEGKTHFTAYINPMNSTTLTSNNLLQRMKENNICPVLETVRGISYGASLNFGTLSVEVNNFKLLTTASGSQIPVLESIKKAGSINQIITDYASMTIDPANPNAFIYDSRLKEDVVYDLYDDTGRLLEYHTVNGKYTSVIWGYKNQYPIAKIENARYSELASYISNLQSLSNEDFDACGSPTCKEQILRAALNNLRTVGGSENWFVKTFTYDYDKGITSSTDERGITEYYEYDNLGRLLKIKDFEGNTLKAYQYNYKN